MVGQIAAATVDLVQRLDGLLVGIGRGCLPAPETDGERRHLSSRLVPCDDRYRGRWPRRENCDAATPSRHSPDERLPPAVHRSRSHPLRPTYDLPPPRMPPGGAARSVATADRVPRSAVAAPRSTP